MSPATAPVTAPAPQPGLFKAIFRMTDWRLVAAIGLPLWAFLIGIVVSRKPAPPPPEPVEMAAALPSSPQAPSPAARQVEVAPPPREVVVRTEVVSVPVVVPLQSPTEPVAASGPAAPEEFKLPASELLPADHCNTFDTKIRFHPDLVSAATEAKTSKKMLLVLHISGNFDDPGFT